MARTPVQGPGGRILRGLALTLTAVAALTAPAAAVAASGDEGEVRFIRNARSSFDPWLSGSTQSEQQWMRDHYFRMRGYAPYYDRALGWAPKSRFYKDAYAIYNDRKAYSGRPDLTTLDRHPDWVLRDAQGNRLYIPYACSGGSCPQLAADIGNPEWRAAWIADAVATLNRGYAGIFVDDVNLEWRVGDRWGNAATPVDQRTGSPMTLSAWRGYFADFMAELRAAAPQAEIVHNPLWFSPHSDPAVQAQVDAADTIELERGFNDGGIVGGSGTYGYRTYLDHVDWLHNRGKSVIFEAYGLDPASRMFEIASYLLVSAGGDAVSSDFTADPDNWWSGWDTDLGAALGDRYLRDGAWRRDFAGGMALVNEPGAQTRTVQLPSGSVWRDMAGNVRTEVTLGARRGIVLTREGGTAPDAGSAGAGDATTLDNVELKPRRRGVRRGRRVTLRGLAEGAETAVVLVRKSGRWRAARAVRTANDGRFRVRIRARGRGTKRFRAIAPTLRPSRVVRVRVR